MGVKFKSGISGNPNGRPKGSQTKFRFDVAQILKEMKCNPFEILAQIANGKLLDDEGKKIGVYTRMQAATELCSYVAPKLKHIEHAADSATPFNIQLIMGIRSEEK